MSPSAQPSHREGRTVTVPLRGRFVVKQKGDPRGPRVFPLAKFTNPRPQCLDLRFPSLASDKGLVPGLHLVFPHHQHLLDGSFLTLCR